MSGIVKWFTRNHVAANLLLVLVIALGVHALFNRVPLEIFPKVGLERISIGVGWKGASPENVEQAITIRVEEALGDLEGIKAITSVSSEGSSSVRVDIERGYDPEKIKEEIQEKIEALSGLPEDADSPSVRQVEWVREVISLAVYGNRGELELRNLTESIRDDLLALPGISIANLDGVRNFEISVEVPELSLRKHGLTLEDVSNAIRSHSLDLSAGSVSTGGGEILFNAEGQALDYGDFLRIPVLRGEDGRVIRLGELAEIGDGFVENRMITKFNGYPAAMIEVYRTESQNVVEVAKTVQKFVDELQPRLPEGIMASTWDNNAARVEKRLSLLLGNALQGGLLVILLLGIFLSPYVAFWVSIGIPVSFLGTIALMPHLGVTFNLVSLFGFILVLGIVVDDAIVTGESIFSKFRKTRDGTRSAIEGTLRVATPVTFGVLTTVAVFIPLMMIEGPRGNIFSQISLVVIPILLISLIESKTILPAHLKFLKMRRKKRFRFSPLRIQRSISIGYERNILRFYKPLVKACMEYRYLTFSVFVFLLVVSLGVIQGGWLRFVFFPRIESETARATLTMPDGTPFEVLDSHASRMVDVAKRLQKKYADPDSGESVIVNIYSVAGASGNTARVEFEITPPEERKVEIGSRKLVNEWRREIGPVPGAEELNFRAEFGRSSDPVSIKLTGLDESNTEEVVGEIRELLRGFDEITDIGDTFSSGKEELRMNLKEAGKFLGVNLAQLAVQVRNAFWGIESQTVIRGNHEIGVWVRYPKEERQSLESLYRMRIRLPNGNEAPFPEVAAIERGYTPKSIEREDGSRVIYVNADLNKETANIESIKTALNVELGKIAAKYPGLGFSLEGEAREQRDSLFSLALGAIFAVFGLYALLAIPLKSYRQPLIVMSVLPFGLVGVVGGHLLLGFDMTFISLMGMLALSGVMVNDCLILVDFANKQRSKGHSLEKAVGLAGAARFRAISLTSLTTFGGLLPIMFEKSTQAVFLIPMAISLAFGILFATFATLLLVPVNYLILNDIRKLLRQAVSWVLSLYFPNGLWRTKEPQRYTEFFPNLGSPTQNQPRKDDS